jgi:hypothetical protein
MISGEVIGHAFIVSGQSAKSVEPGKAAFDHPTPGQKNKLLLSFHLGQLYHDQLDAPSLALFSSFISCISLVRIRDLHTLPTGLLHLITELSHLMTFLLVSGGYHDRQEVPQRVYCHMDL